MFFLLPVFKCEQARLVQAAAAEVRIALVTCFQGKMHPCPLPATVPVPVLLVPSEVLLVYLHGQSRALGLSCFLEPGVLPVAWSLVRSPGARWSGVFVSIYKRET